MINDLEIIDTIFERLENCDSLSNIACDPDTDEYDIQMLMRKHPIRFEVALAIRNEKQIEKFRQIRMLADKLAFKRLGQLEKTIQADSIPELQRQKAIDNIDALCCVVTNCLDWFARDQLHPENDSDLPFEVIFEDYEPD